MDTFAVCVITSHPINDGRIKKHVSTLIKNGVLFTVIKVLKIGEQCKAAPRHYTLLKVDGGKITRRLNLYLNNKSIVIKIRETIDKLLTSARIVILHIHDPELLFLSKIFSPCERENIRLVYDKHEYYSLVNSRHFSEYESWFNERLYIKYIDAIAVVTEYMKSNLFLNIPIVLVPNYPLNEYFDDFKITNKIDGCLENMLIKIVYVGSLSERDRDITTMVQLFRSMLESSGKFEILVCGRYLSPKNKKIFDNLTDSFGDSFKYYEDVDYNQAMSYVEAAHYGIIAIQKNRKNGNYGKPLSLNKLYEYMRCGCVPIVSGIDDEIDGIPCFINIDLAKNIDALVEEIYMNKNIKTMMRKNLDRSKDFVWDEVGTRYLSIYEKISEV